MLVKCLLIEIIPICGVTEGMSSDKGPHSVVVLIQETARILNIKWDLHNPWRPNSSGKAERMNQTLKGQVRKLCQVTQLKWMEVLPIVLPGVQGNSQSSRKCKPVRNTVWETLYYKFNWET